MLCIYAMLTTDENLAYFRPTVFDLRPKCKKQLDLESRVFANFLTIDRRAKRSKFFLDIYAIYSLTGTCIYIAYISENSVFLKSEKWFHLNIINI